MLWKLRAQCGRTAASRNLAAVCQSSLPRSSGPSLVDGFRKSIIWALNDVAEDKSLPADTKLVLNTDAPNKVIITEEGERILHVRTVTRLGDFMAPFDGTTPLYVSCRR